MDEVKVEPDSEGEIYESLFIKQESPAEEERVPEPFAFAAVKVEAEVRINNLWTNTSVVDFDKKPTTWVVSFPNT